MTESYSASYKAKHQEYLLEQSLQRLNIKKAQGEISETVRQLSVGPFIFEPQYNSLRISIADNNTHVYVGLRYNERMISKKVFLIRITGALRDCVQQDFPEKREVNSGYANLILQLIRNSDVYDHIIKAYEYYNVALEALDEVERNLQAWNEEVQEIEDEKR